MALPISGTLGINDIRASVGMLSTNVSLRQCTLVTAVGSNGATTKISNFYGWHGYGYYYPTVPFGNYFDFALNGLYANSGSTISDLSGQGLNGTFVTGTGTGTATTIDQYTSTFPGYLTIPGDTPQKSVRLDNAIKMGGTASYTVIVWVRVSSFTSSFPGVVAAEGRSGSNPIGWSMYLDNNGGYHINHTRWSGTSGTGQTTTITFGSGGVPAFAFDTWYMVTAIYDGAGTMGIYLHTGGTRYLTTASNSYSLATDASWGAFLGLRYNNWLNGRIGYYAVYGSPLLSAWVDTVYAATRIRYGV